MPQEYSESSRTLRPERRELLVSKAWIQTVAVVVLFGFFVLGLLAYRTYSGEAPIPARVIDPGRNLLFTRGDILSGQQVFLRNGLMEYDRFSVMEPIWVRTSRPTIYGGRQRA